jgi:hypothetical protein
VSNSVTATLAYGLVVNQWMIDGEGLAPVARALGVTLDADDDAEDEINAHLDAMGLRCVTFGSWSEPSWVIGRVIAEADGDDVGYETTTPAKVVAAMRRTKAASEVFAAIRRAFPWVKAPRLVVVVMRG